MEELFYIPIEKDEDEYFQNIVLDQDELFEYHSSVYKKIIDTYFTEKEAIVNLKTGKYYTSVFEPKDKTQDIYFCLVNINNYPSSENEIGLNEEIVETIRDILSNKIKYSEGIVPDQKIDIFSNFVTPRIKFLRHGNEEFYNYAFFPKDCIIFGAPGAGKTTLLRRLTLDYLYHSLESKNKLKKLPIYVQLREFNNYSNNFETYIDNCIKNSFSNINLYLKNELSSTGNLFLMLDGADEIDFEKFHSFKETIIKFKKNNPLISFVITSRPDRDYENIIGFEKCYIQPFNKNQIKELTFRKLSKHGKWKEYISALNSVPDVYEVLKNPLLLTISHFLYLYKSILPLNSGQLMKELVATLVNNWDSQRNIERKLNNKVIIPLEITHSLGKMSLALSESKKESITSEELFGLLKNYDTQEEFDSFLKYIEFSTGLIKNEGERLWCFTHKSIQDFFCSNYLVESVGELNKSIFIDKDWDKILQMISGLSSDPNYVINSILNQPQRTEIDKLKNSLSIYNESILLTKNDIKHSFELLETYFVHFEKTNKITSKNIKVQKYEVLFKKMNELAGFKEIVSLIYELYKMRFTKYEYDFSGYLNHSNSKILKSISNLRLEKGNISIESINNETILSFCEESPDVSE